MATLPRDFDDSSIQQCGRMAYSCFNWAMTITMNLPLEKLHIFMSMAAF